MKGQINNYICDQCGRITITQDIDDGVTPFMIKCRATKGCAGFGESTFYKPLLAYPIMIQWCRPNFIEYLTLSRENKRHVREGGLMPREMKNYLKADVKL